MAVPALAKQAKYLSEMRSVLGRNKPYILVPELYQVKGSGKKATAIVRTPAETVAQCYMGIIHGARGILLFAELPSIQSRCSEELFGRPSPGRT